MSQDSYGPRQSKAIPWPLAAMPVYTLGVLAAVPFLYAAMRMRTRRLGLIAGAYSAVCVVAWVFAAVGARDNPTSALGGFLFIALAVVGTTHAFVLRQSLAGGDRPVETRVPVPPLVAPPPPTRAQVQVALGSFKSYVASHAQAFPPACTELLHEIVAQLDEVVSFVTGEGHADTELNLVHAMLTDYLPTSLNTYVRLPREFAVSQRNPDGRTAAEELELQLRLLRDNARDAAGSLYRGDALRLQEQSAFLHAKFGMSELDLP